MHWRRFIQQRRQSCRTIISVSPATNKGIILAEQRRRLRCHYKIKLDAISQIRQATKPILLIDAQKIA
jgi:hypothetical protein